MKKQSTLSKPTALDMDKHSYEVGFVDGWESCRTALDTYASEMNVEGLAKIRNASELERQVENSEGIASQGVAPTS